MKKTATINTRIDPALKHKAESILQEVGLSRAEAIRIFYTQICLKKGLPFEVKLPSDSTQSALDELDSGQGSQYSTLEELWGDLDDA